MSARFEMLAGASMTGKTYSLSKQVLEEAHANPDKRYYIVVPEQSGNAYEKKLIQMNQALFGAPGFMNIDILGFNRLSYRIFEEFGIKDTNVLEEYEKNMLVRVASGRVRGDLEIYGGSVDRTGFTQEVKSLISEMIQYNVTPEELEKAAEDISKTREGLSAKLRDVSKIYSGFMDILDNRRTSVDLGQDMDFSMTISEERLKLLARILKTDRPCSITDGAVFIFDEYRGYTPDQLSVIGALKKRAEVLRFSLCIEANTLKRFLDGDGEVSETDIFHQSYMTYRHLAETLGEKPEVQYLRKSAKESSELIHLTQNIFRYPVKEYKNELSDLEIYHTDSFENELRLVAEKIHSEVKAGYRYKDIAVVTGDIEEFDRCADRIFAEYDIPMFSDFSRKLRKNPYTEAILRILDILDRDFDYNSIFGFVKTGVLKIDDHHSLDELENFCLRTGMRGRTMWNRAIRTYGKNVPEEKKEAYKKMNEVRKLILSTIEPVTKLGNGKHLVSEYITALLEIIEALSFESQMESNAQLLEAEGMMTDARVMKSLYGVLMGIISQTDDLLGNEEMDIHSFSEILSAGINEIKVGVIPPTIDALAASDVERSRIIDAKIVHVVGACDGVIPAKKGGGRILSDKDKEQLSNALSDMGSGKYLASFGVEQSQNSLFMIYQLLSKATEKLTISYHVSGAASRDKLSPSFLIGRVRKLFPGLVDEYKECSDFSGTALSDRKAFLGWVREAIEDEQSGDTASLEDKKLVDNISRYITYVGAGDDLPERDQILPGLLFSNSPEIISSEAMDTINLKLSVSKMEKYASCPYSFFMTYILGLKERPEKKLELYDIGNVMHRALENTFGEIYEKMNNDWKGIEDAELIDIVEGYLETAWVEEMTEEYQEDVDDDLDPKTARIKENLRELASRTITTLRSQIVKGEFLPDRFEQKFEAEFTAHKPDGTEYPVTLRGVIDRLDTAEIEDNYYLRVVDYKTGSKTFDPLAIQEGTDIQLLVYTKIVNEILRSTRDKVIPAGMYYYTVSDPVLELKTKGQKEMAEAEDADGLEKEIRKSMVMKGVSNADPIQLLNLHDKTLIDEAGNLTQNSDVITIKKGRETPLTMDSMTLSGEQLDSLTDYSLDKMRETADKILTGDFAKSPINMGLSGACTYCNFKAACRFSKYGGKKRFPKKEQASNSEMLVALCEKAQKNKEDGKTVRLKKAKFVGGKND
ncbi:MAG: PD-(D/E)XK nuclease family protein [Eubacterium sp.]|nr:PD-(D/E)XK nuclease family protein [Eubacterium sp.]